MGRLERLVMLLLVGAVASYLLDAVRDLPDGRLRPPIQAPQPPASAQRPVPALPADALPPPSPSDPVFGVRVEPRRGGSTGTAFAIDATGLWATARHVVHDCRRVALRSARGWVEARVVWTHAQADFAVIRSFGGIDPLPLSGEALRRDQQGFAIGFPQGRPGSVHGRVLGRSQMQAEGRFRGRAPTVTWAELGRVPDFEGSLGGISGGPMLDADGNVIGVIVAESPRRGRFETLAPELLPSLGASGARPLRAAPGDGRAGLDARTLPRVADQLRDRLRVAQAACAAG